MGKLFTIVMALMLSACTHRSGAEQHSGLAQEPLACPVLPSSLGYSVRRTINGVDWIICTITSHKAGGLPAEVYIGNFPYAQHDVQFFGYTPSRLGPLVWFTSTSDHKRHLVTYIPTGFDFPAVVMLSVETPNTPSLQQLATVADIVVGHSPNISIQRTRYARR
jgi:hypothetical protein